MTRRILSLRIVFGFLVALFFSFAAYVTAWALYDVRWHIEVDSISINDTVLGEPQYVDVARRIHGNWEGGYRVTIRHQPEGYIFCDTGNVDVPYREFNDSGQPMALPDPMALSYWAAGGTCSFLLAKNAPPMPVGLYSMETCHYVYAPLNVYPKKTLCWPTNIFRVYETTIDLIQRKP